MKLTKIIVIFSLLVFVPFVSAQYYGGGFWSTTEQVINSIVSNLEPLLRALLGGDDWTGYLLFEKVLLFLLITIMVGLILGNLPIFKDKRKGIIRFVALIIGILGVRNLNYIWVNTILVQYQALFIAVAGVLPFMIYWYFVKDFDSPVRKFAWVFYSVIYLGLWATTTVETYGDLYLWAALFALIYAFLFDTWVQQWLNTSRIKKQFARHTWNNIADINERIGKLTKQIAEGTHPNPVSARSEIRDLANLRESLAKGKNIT